MRLGPSLPHRSALLVILILAISLSPFIAGCGATPSPSPTPTKTPTTAPTATATLAPLAAMREQPTSTATAIATATPLPTATATMSPTPPAAVDRTAGSALKATLSITAVLEAVLPGDEISGPLPPGPPSIPAQWREPSAATTPAASILAPATATPAPAYTGPTTINRLTGLPVPSYRLNRRPLGIKVPNFPIEARPQSGLSLADVVVEHEAEARLTRFTAIFWGNDVTSELGPVRSVRLVDGELMSIFKSTLVTSGGHPTVKIRATEGKAWAAGYLRIICPEEPFLGAGNTMRRVPKPGRRYELTLYTDTASLWGLSAQRGINQGPDFAGMWAFADAAPPGGASATHLKIVYKPSWSVTEYRYDPGTATYKRSDLGAPTIDALTGRQIAPSNVVLLYANHVNSDIAADTHDPNNIYYSIIIQLWGQGSGKLLRDGQVYDLRWVREDAQGAGDRLLFLDTSGNPLPLRPGATWIQLVRLDGVVQID
ncbi:MAG: DUF3048 domain-containing protein [Anaerolineae bacterium]|nr:DUF3048 domain-containing protein [Anaerolineae bacterium]